MDCDWSGVYYITSSSVLREEGERARWGTHGSIVFHTTRATLQESGGHIRAEMSVPDLLAAVCLRGVSSLSMAWPAKEGQASERHSLAQATLRRVTYCRRAHSLTYQTVRWECTTHVT